MLLRQLQYIIAVEELKNFTKAASKCCVTQSTLSLQIKGLEDYFGIQFFDRKKYPIELTAQGEALIDKAREVVKLAKEFEEAAKNMKVNNS